MSGRVLIAIDKCQPGMKVAETVFNDYGAVIVAQGSVLNERIIDKLKMLEIHNIKVLQASDREMKKNIILPQEQYEEQVDEFRDIIKGVSSGQKIDTNKVNTVVGTILANINKNSDIVSCINKVRSADEYTYFHSVNVSLLSMMLGRWLGLDEAKIRNLVYAGVLHDIGKAKIDLSILNKPGKLTPEEFEEIKKHVSYGYRILEEVPNINQEIAVGALMHHERENGSGYEMKIGRDEIHTFAKIIAVTDVYDAMTSNRVYRAKLSPFEVFSQIESDAYSGQFDTSIALTFLNNIANYYIGDKCRLSDGRAGEIIFINPNNISKPLIKVNNECIYLSDVAGLKIEEII